MVLSGSAWLLVVVHGSEQYYMVSRGSATGVVVVAGLVPGWSRDCQSNSGVRGYSATAPPISLELKEMGGAVIVPQRGGRIIAVLSKEVGGAGVVLQQLAVRPAGQLFPMASSVSRLCRSRVYVPTGGAKCPRIICMGVPNIRRGATYPSIYGMGVP